MSNTRKVTEPLDLDVLIAEAKNEPYRFNLGGKERQLPHVKTLTMPQMRLLDSGQYDVAMPQLDVDDELAELIVGLPGFAIEELHKRWLKHSGIDVGESQASSSS